MAQRKAEEQKQKADAERRRAETFLYCNQMAQAQRYWLANNIELADSNLDDCPPEMHRWEWHCLKRLTHAEFLRPGLERADVLG